MITLITIGAIGIVCLLLEILGLKKLIVPFTITGFIFAIVLNAIEISDKHFLWTSNDNMMEIDTPQSIINILLIVLMGLIVLMVPKYYRDRKDKLSDYVSLKAFMLAGAVAMVGFGNLLMFFLGLEVLSVSAYIMAVGKPEKVRSNEAGMKYFVMGAVASAFVLLGIAFVYGSLATFDVVTISELIISGNILNNGWLDFGIILISIGMFFKCSIFPFQFWAPDVYQGSPTLTTATMSTVVKVAALCSFFYLAKIFHFGTSHQLVLLIAILAIATMTVANITALRQRNMKRLMAYSGISHAGFMLLTLIGIDGILQWDVIIYYNIAYSLATLVVFGIILIMTEEKNSDDLSTIRGLFFRRPLLSIVFIIALLSLGGIPIFAGFFAKYYLFIELLYNQNILLAVFAALNSVIAIFYYFTLINMMFQTDYKNIDEAMTAGKRDILYISRNYLFVVIFASILLFAFSIWTLWDVLFL